MKLVKFCLNFGRMGSLDSVALIGPKGWELLQWLVESKAEVYFGEVLGKHSDVWCVLKSDHFEVLVESSNQDNAKALGVLSMTLADRYSHSDWWNVISGDNPLVYWLEMTLEKYMSDIQYLSVEDVIAMATDED